MDGKPFAGDPRYILRKTIQEAEAMGYTFDVGPELEFFLFHMEENGQPTTNTNERAGYFDLGPLDFGENARRDMVLTLEEMGLNVEASHHEVAPAQHEIDIKYDDALTTADNIMTFKLVARTIAKRHGLHATFMPKPKYGVDGSGMHINMSLKKDGRNIFEDTNDKLGLSEEAYYFIAGIMKYIESMAAITNPLVNSYKRLVPNYEAPVYVAWSVSNRSPLIRIPANRGASTRLELRNPDPSANPYLTLALCLAAGLDGIKNKLTPPQSIDCNVFEMSEQERTRLDVHRLPLNLCEAIANLENSDFVKGVLGEHISKKYIEAKKVEWEDYRTQVTRWELDQYLYRI
jgi:glutamine synthetase